MMSLDVRSVGSTDLFGGVKPWDAGQWTPSDDRVRGGKSQSYLKVEEGIACFSGTLDIKTLGGAGFASQKCNGTWDLSQYKAITLSISNADKKRYTFILKDELLGPDPETGREQSTVSYEVDFGFDDGETQNQTVTVPFDSLTPTYRGRPKKDAASLDTKKIKQISLMMRSHFGAQSGDFSLSIKSISALTQVPKHASTQKVPKDAAQLEEGPGDRLKGDQSYHFSVDNRFCRADINISQKLVLILVAIAAMASSYRLTRWLMEK